MGFSIIDNISNLTQKKLDWSEYDEQSIKDFDVYMLNQWLSMDYYLIDIINHFQHITIDTLSKRDVYNLYKGILPNKRIYIKYIKSKQTKKNNNIKELAEYVKKYHHNTISINESIEYIKLFYTKVDIKNMLDELGVDDKKIKSLIKKL